MVRERIQELVDFATTESPYKSNYKGWINKDVYLQWGKAFQNASSEKAELAKFSVFWKPLNQIFLGLIFVLSISLICVFFALSIAGGKVNLALFSFQETEQLTTFEMGPIEGRPDSINESSISKDSDVVPNTPGIKQVSQALMNPSETNSIPLDNAKPKASVNFLQP